MKYVISLGGSAIYNNGDFDRKFVSAFKKTLIKSDHEFIIIVGGGNFARKLQEKGRERDLSNKKLDEMGIKATKFNAKYVKEIFGEDAYKEVVSNPNEIKKIKSKIIICSGWKPGFSTDYVSVYIAKMLEVKEIINITGIDYVYHKDPRKEASNPIKEMTWKEMQKLVGEKWFPGMKKPFDPIATKNTKGLTVYLISNDIRKLNNFLDKGKVFGTIIHD